jgi:hypothetical protein
VDIILGTDWLTRHQAVIDIAARAIEVHSPTCGETTLYLPDQGCTRSCAFTMIESPVEKIPVVCDYPDVFPDELPGMPPDRDIEFAIELQPGTAPISKRPYRMPPAELAELKKQLQELLDKGVQVIKEMIKQKAEKYKCFRHDSKGILWFGDRLVVPKNPELRKKLLDEAHLSKFSMHPGGNKMYHDLRSLYWWTRMKREIAKYISECDTWRRVKASHLKVAGTLQPLPIPSWKWEDICMDFIVGLPNTSRHYDSIWVIVDRLTKTAHFLPVHTTHKIEKYAEIYIDQIVRLQGILKTIVYDRGALFVARFWEQLQESLGTRAIRSSSYHPQTDGQTERVNQILEDMLRACVLHYGKNWDKCLSLAEFSYNNSY